MPSINRTIPIHSERRLRINTCEGSVSISDEQLIGHGRWGATAAINLTREQAEKLIAQLADQMAKHY